MDFLSLILITTTFFSAADTACITPKANQFANASSGKIREAGEMRSPRAAHTATLLKDGRVLIAGGFVTGGRAIAAAETFVSASERFEPVGNLVAPRASHSATLLPNGKVLIAGGFNGDYLRSTEIFDPQTGTFAKGPDMTIARSEHTATLLSDGRILLAGGVGTGWTFLAEAEIFDPETGRFKQVGRMSTPRESHTATLLKDGKVLITGGHKDRRASIKIFATAEIFDPKDGSFERIRDLRVKRHKHAAVLLKNGQVLIVGGSDENDSEGAYTSLELFDPNTRTFRLAGEMRKARYKLNGAVVLLVNGNVLIAGGSEGAEIYDPATGATSEVPGGFGSHRLFATATLLNNGEVLIIGGYDRSTSVSKGTWLFDGNTR